MREEAAVTIPNAIHINEEGPREGFQFEKGPIATDRKIELIDALSETGLESHPGRVLRQPKPRAGLADADEVVKGYQRSRDPYTALWLNTKGLQRAIATNRLDIEGSFSLTASPTFLRATSSARSRTTSSRRTKIDRDVQGSTTSR